jgi:protein-disulfide isomerase
MSDEMKVVTGVTIVSILILIIGIFVAMAPPVLYEQSRLITSDTITSGSKNASVYLVEFSDFQCPACGAFAPVIEELRAKYGDTLLFAYRHFPLPQHSNAQYAAQAFEAAAAQGKAWEMSAYLFAHQKALSKEKIYEGAKSLGLNMDTFSMVIESQKVKDKVLLDAEQARLLQVNSTPTFFLNGKKLNLASTEDLKRAVDEVMQTQ